MTRSKQIFKQIRAISTREIRLLCSSGVYYFAMLGAPLFSTVFFLSLMSKGLPSDLPVVVVDMDRSTISRNITRQLDAFEQTDVVEISPDFNVARDMMQRGEIYGIMLLPEGLSRDVANGQQPKITYYTNNSFLIAGSLLFRDMKTMSVLASGAAERSVRLAKGQDIDAIMAQLQPIVIHTHPIGNPWLNYSIYLSNIMLPGVLCIMIMLVTVYSIGMEIKRASAKEFLKMADGNLSIAMIGKLLPQTIIFCTVGWMMLGALYGWMGFPLHSGIVPMGVAMLLLVLACQGCGVFMISVLPNVRLGLSFASLWGVLSFSIAGLTFPVTAMHPSLQALANLFPLRHYFLIYVDQALNGWEIHYTIWQYVALVGFVILPVLVLRPLKNALLYSKYKM